MGKGQRVRAARAVEKEAMKAELIKKAKKAKLTRIVSLIVVAVLFVTLFGGVLYHTIYSSAYNKGTIQRDTVVLKSDNYTVDAAMMSYFFYTQYNNFVSTYSSYISSLGLDTSKSLKRQQSAFDKDSTWYDYFCDQAGSQVKELVYLAEKAVEKGMKLDDEDKASIKSTIDTYYETAEENKIDKSKFLGLAFGTGVNESDVTKCLELSVMADKYHQSYMDELKYSDAEIEKFYTDNIDDYRYVDYYSYSVVSEDSKDDAKTADAKKKATELSGIKTVDAFKAWVDKTYRAENPVTKDNTKEKQDEGAKKAVDALLSEQVTYTKDDKASEWLFKTGKKGETYLHDEGEGVYTVYLLVATPYRDETATRTIRDIVLTTENYKKEELKTQAEKIMKEMKAAGLTEETFKKFAAEYSENTACSANGGLCENYKKSSFEGHIGDWTYNSARKAGDFEAFEIDDGYAICYYVGEGIPAWKMDCTSAKKNADYEAAYEKWEKEITLTENEKGYKKIPDNV